MSCPKERGEEVPIKITLNGRVIFEGAGAYPEGRLTRQEYEVPSGVLKAGVNRLTIENLLKEGRAGSRPWFGVDRVEVNGFVNGE